MSKLPYTEFPDTRLLPGQSLRIEPPWAVIPRQPTWLMADPVTLLEVPTSVMAVAP